MDYSSSDDDGMALYAMENSGRPTSGRVGGLQTYIHTPKSDAHPEVALVVVHQCTAMGGCALAAEDIASACCHRGGFLTVGFDMRGAGRSKGCCTLGPFPCLSGCAEVSDVVAVAQWVRDELQRDVWLVGVSAGGPVAGSALGKLPCIRGYIGIAYTFGIGASLLFFPHHRVLLSPKPKLFIQGTKDIFTSVATFKIATGLARAPCTAHVVGGTGHFDLEYSPYSALHAELIAAFVDTGGLGERARDGARGLAAYLPSLCTGGPCCCITLLVLAGWLLSCTGRQCW